MRAQTPAIDETWINPGTGSWFTAGNWTPASVPTNTQNVLVGNGGTAQVLGGTASATSLTVGQSSTVQTGTNGFLSVNNTVVNSGNLIGDTNGVSLVAGGSVINNATGLIAATATALGSGSGIFFGGPANIVNAGAISGNVGIFLLASADITNNAGGTIQGTAGSTPSWGIADFSFSSAPVTITNFGTISGSDDGIDLNGGGQVFNQAGGSITSTNLNRAAITLAGATEEVTNAGTISGNGGVYFAAAGSVNNNTGGIIQGAGVNGYGIYSSGPINVTNSGTISGPSGVVLIAGGSITNNVAGSITAPAPTTGNFTQGVLASGGATRIDNSGLISGENGIVFNAGGTVTNKTGGTIQGVSRNDNGFDSFTGSGILAFGNSTPVTVINGAGATIQGLGTFSWGIHTGPTPISITNFGVISGTINAINVNGGGRLINEAGASITSTTFQPIAVTSGGVENIVNFGTISSAFGGINFFNGNASGNITNGVSGIIAGTGSGSFGIATSGGNVISVINSGTISGEGSGIVLAGGGSIANEATGSIVATSSAPGALTQAISVSSGVAKIANSGLISGDTGIAFNGSAGGTVINSATGTIAGSGSAIVTGKQPVTITNYGKIAGTQSGIYVNAGGSFTNAAGASVTSAIFEPVAVAGVGIENITNSGKISSSFGGIGFGDGNPSDTNVTGTVTNNAGGLIQGTGANSFGIGSSSGAPITVINSGTISGVHSGFGANVGGFVTNNAGGLIQATGPGGHGIGLGPTSVIVSTILNSGTISGATGIGLANGGSVTNNAGSLVQGTGPSSVGISSASNGNTLSLVNSGTISGATGIHVGGSGGSITNNSTGTITGTDGDAIDARSSTGVITVSNAGTIKGAVDLGNAPNTFTIVPGSEINGNLNLGSNAGSKLVLGGAGTQAISQAVTGSITNSGSLTKQGSGTWTIDEALSAPVSTSVLAGVLVLNSTLNTPSVNVQAGATLAGSGFITGSLANSGTVSPGDAPGTLQIGGNYRQNASGVLNIQIASATAYSRLVVGGQSFLNGTLRLTLSSGYRPNPSTSFSILTAGHGITGTFSSIQGPKGISVSYFNGVVDVTTAAQKPVVAASDGIPSSTTAIISNDIFFNSLGSLAGRAAAESGNSIGIAFDGGEFYFEGQRGHEYGFPIAGSFKITDRVGLDYEIPLYYVTFPEAEFFESGLILSFPIKLVEPRPDRAWSWQITPTGAVAATGSREVIGAGALTNVFSYRWRDVTLTYGNYISFFEGETLTNNDPEFPQGTSQQIMKNGLKVNIPFGKDWFFEAYGIYTNFFQSAPVSSYYTIGAEVGRHLIWKEGERNLDLGYYSVGLYTEQGNHYSSGHIQFGSAWRF